MSRQHDIDSLKKRLAGLSPKQRRALLEKLGKGADLKSSLEGDFIEKATPLEVETIQNEEGERYEVRKFMASAAQSRMWFLDQFFYHQPVYSSPMTFHLQGKLDADLLEESFNQVTPAIQEMIDGRQVMTSEAAYRVKEEPDSHQCLS